MDQFSKYCANFRTFKMKWTILLFFYILTARAQNFQGSLSRQRRAVPDCAETFSDFYFAIDLPRALTNTNLRFLRNYVTDLLEGLAIGRDQARVSITSFGTSITHHITLNDTQTEANAVRSLRSLRLQKVGAKVIPIQAMDYMIDNLLIPENGYRSVNDSVCVLIFGTRFRGNARRAGSRLLQLCRVIAIGLGNAASRTNRISSVTNGPGQTILSRSYKTLNIRVSRTLRTICLRPLRAPRPEVNETTRTTVTVRYVLQPFATGYTVSIQELGFNTPLQTIRNIPRNEDTVTFRRLREATTYVVFVSAHNEEESESPRGSVLVTTSLPIPEPEVEENSISETSAVIFWQPVKSSNEVSYTVTVSLEGGTRNDSFSLAVDGTRIPINSLQPGRRYNVTLRTIFERLMSDESDPVVFMTVPAPPDLQLARVRLVEMLVVWDRVPGAIAYDIVMTDVQTEEDRRFEGLTRRSLLIDNLVPSRRYELRATTIGEEDKNSAISDPLIVTTAPSNPEEVTETDLTRTSISFRWSAQTAALGYRIIITSRDDPGYRLQRRVSVLRFTATGMQPGAFYRIVVLSLGRDDVTDRNVIFPLIAQTLPDPPRNLAIVDATANSLRVSWNPTPGARAFHVFTQKLDGGTLTGSVIETANTSTFSAVVPNLEPGTRYQIRVSTEAIQTGTSGLSNPVQDSTYAAVPSVPRAVEVTSSHMSIQVDPAEGAEIYLLSWVSVDAQGNLVGLISGEVTIRDLSTPYDIESLSAGTWLNITVRSVSHFGKTNPVPSPTLVDQTAPLSPFAGSFLEIGSTSLEYSWRPVDGALSYVITVQSDDFDETFTEEYLMEFETTNTSYLVENLLPGTVYRFNLQSVGHRGVRSRQGSSSFRQTVPDNPSNVRHGIITDSTIQLLWNPAKGASNYRIEIDSNETSNTPNDVISRDAGATISSLFGGTWYTFTIYARNQRRQEGPVGSEPLHLQTVLSPPTGVELSRPTVNSFTVSWRVRPGSLGYRVRAFTPDSNVDTKVKSVRVIEVTEALVDDLDPGTRYQFFVASIGFQGQISAESQLVSDITLPTAPDQPLEDRVTSSTITISWNPVKGAERYRVSVVQDISNPPPPQVRRTTSNQLRFENFVPGGWYIFTVRSIGRENRENREDSPALRVQTVPLAPISIDFDEFTTTSIRLEWNAVVGAGGYAVTATDATLDTLTSEQETSNTNLVVTGLSPGTAYIFDVATIGEDDDRRSRTTVSAREETNPAAPEIPTAVDVTDEHIRFRWRRVQGARRYVVMVTSSAAGENHTLEVSTNSAFVHDLQSGTPYTCRVFSVGIRNRQNPVASPSLNVYTAPLPPTGITTSNVATTRLSLGWQPVQGALSYRVTVENVPRQNEAAEQRDLDPITVTETVVNGLEPGTEYLFRIRAIGNEDRESSPHPEFRDATLPETPDTPRITRVFTTSIRYTWSRTPGAIRYRIFVTQEGENTEELSSVNPTFVLTDLESGTRYTFSVQAVGSLDRLSARTSDSVMQQTITEPSARFRVTNTRSELISLQWEAAVGASSYFLRVESNGNVVRELTVSTTSIDVTGLTSGTDYHFQLRSIGDENVRSTQVAELEEITLPEAPEQVETTDVAATEIRLDWPDVRGASHYDVRVNGEATERTPFSQITLENLDAGLYYEIQIFSMGVLNRLSEDGSDIIRIQTDPTPPMFTVSDVTTNSISIAWPEVTGASSYVFQIQSLARGVVGETTELDTENANLVIPNLEPGVEYSITGVSIGQQEGRSTSRQLSDFTLPRRPDDLEIVLVTSTTIQLRWQRQRGALAYLVEIDGNNQPIRVENNQYVERGLDQGTFYSVVVYSVGYKERRNPRGSGALRVQTASGAAGNFVVTEETITSIALSWDDVVGRSQFEIVVSTVRDTDDLDIPNRFKQSLPLTYTIDETTAEIVDLIPGVEYLFRLKAFGQQGQLSNEESRVIGVTLPTVPQGLQEVEATTTTVTIMWESSQGAERYEVSMKNDDVDVVSSYTTEETSYTVTSLTPGGFYEFTVYAIGTSNKRNPVGSDSISSQTVPLPPQNYHVVDATTTEISLEWEDVLGRSRFSIVVTNLDDDNADPITLSSQATSITIPNLPTGTAFNIQIRTIGMQPQKNSEVIDVEKSTVPATVETSTVVQAATTTISLQWNGVHGAIRYFVETTRIDAGRPETNNIQRNPSTNTNFIAEDLVPGAVYSFVIFSVGVEDVENLVGSTAVSQQTVTLPPSGAETTGITVTSFILRWDPVFGATSYTFDVFQRQLSGDLILVNTISESTTSVEVTSLTAGTEYVVELKTVGDEGVESIDATQIIATTLPATIEIPSVVSVTIDSIILEWTAVKGADQYLVEITRVDPAISRDNNVTSEMTTRPRYVAENLMSGAIYEVVIFSVGASGQNERGSTTVQQQTVTLPPSGARSSTITVTSFILSWDPAFGAISYTLDIFERQLSGDLILVTTISESTTSAEVTSLTAGTEYVAELKTVGDEGVESIDSTQIIATTLPATISTPSVLSVTTNSILLEWTAVKGANGYLVEITRVDQETPPDENVRSEMTTSPRYLAENLMPGAVYEVVIFSVGVSGRNTQGSPAVEQQTVTLPPGNVQTEDITVTSFTVRWNPSFGATGYNVYVYELSGANSNLVTTVTAEFPSAEVISLNAGTSYRVQIRTVGQHEVESTESSELELITVPDTLERPTVTEVTTTSISIQWNAVAGAIRYIVEITRSDEQTDEDDVTTQTVDDLQYVARGLAAGATYEIVLFSVGVGDVVNENGSPVVTKQTVPLPPTLVIAENATETTFQLFWSEVYGADSYNVYIYQVVEDSAELFAIESVLDQTYTVVQLNPGTEYRTRVRAVGEEDQESADSVSAITATKPEAVSIISIFNIQTDSLNVEWNEPQGAQRYMIIVRFMGEPIEETSIESKTASMGVIGLMPGIFYEIRVISFGALSVTNTNESVFARAQTVPLPPDNVRISEVMTTSFRVSWSPSLGAASYSLFVTSTTHQRTRDLFTTNTSVEVTGLATGTQYFVSVISTGEENQQSDLTEAVEDTTIPAPTPQLDFSNRSTTTVTLLWEAVTGAVTYEIEYVERDSSSSSETLESRIAELQVTGLETGTFYQFNVFSIGTKGRRNNEGSATLEVQTVPLPPDLIVIRNVQPSTVVVTWNTAIGAASYLLTYQTAVDSIPTSIQTSSTRQEVAGLLSGTAYEFLVLTIGQEGQISEQSQEITRSTLPATPRNVRIEGIFSNSARLSWVDERGAVSYRIAIRNLETGNTVFEMSSSARITIQNLFPGIYYEFVVFSMGVESALNEQGSDPVSNQTIPRAPSRIQVTEVDTNALAVSWQPVTGAAMYFVEVTSSDDDAFVPSSEITFQTSVTFLSLSSGTIYSFSVTAIGQEGQSSEPGQAVSQTVLPGKPLGVRATSVTTTSITLEWQTVKGAIRYRIVTTNQATGEVQESESEETGTDVTSLLAGNRYDIVIFSISVDEKVNPEGSDPLNKQTVTRPPRGVQLSNIATRSLVISWQPVVGAQNYIIATRSEDDEAFVPAEIETAQLSATINAISSGTGYSFTIRAINFEEQRSRTSAPVAGITLPANPNPVRINEVSTTAISLSWPQIKGAIRYRINLLNTETEEVITVTRAALQIELDELEPGTWYEAVVFSVGRQSTNNEGSQPRRIQTVPLAPNNVQAIVDNSDFTTVVVTWNGAKGATQYRATVTSAEANVNIPISVTTADRSATFENLSYGTRYSFSVVAIGAQTQESEASQSIQRFIVPATVDRLEAVDISENTINLVWRPVKGAISYRIAVTNDETNTVKELRSPTPAIEALSLEAGTFYTLQVFSIGEEQTNSVGSEIVRIQTVPEMPNNVLVVRDQTTTSSIFLTWQAVKGVASYEVVYATFGGSNENMVVSQRTAAEVEQLAPGTGYRFNVVAVGQEGQRSEQSGETITATIPEAISDFTITEQTNSSVTLEWPQASGANVYRVDIRNLVNNSTSNVDTTELLTTVAGLISGTRYEVNVVSIGTLGLENSNSAALSVFQTVPNPPRSFEATSVGTTSVQLVWSSARGAVSYTVEVSWTVSGQSNTRNLNSTTNSLLAEDLLPGTRYQFTVRSITQSQLVSGPSRTIEETTRPDAATNLIVEEVTTTTTTLRWETVKGAQRYVVEYWERNSTNNHFEIETTTTRVTVSNLQPGVWYGFMVFSIGARGRQNEEGSAVLHLQTVPLAPSGISIADITTTSFAVTWNEVVGADSFSIRVVRKENVPNREVVLDTEETSIVVPSLVSGTGYDVFVTTVGEENQRSVESVVVSETTMPDPPENLQLVQKQTTTATIRWSAAKGARRYEITIVNMETSQTQVITVDGTSTSLTGLAPGNRYSVTVRSVGVNNRVNPEPSEALQFQTVLLPPININSELVSTDVIQLQWNEAFGAHFYFVRVVRSTAVERTIRVNATTVTVRNLEPGTRYDFFLVSVGDEDQRSDDSAVFQDTTIPNTPTNLQVSNRDTTSVTITWDFVPGAVSFTLGVESNNTNHAMSVQASTNSYTLDNLAAGGWYTVTITSFGVGARSNPIPSNQLVFQTVPVPPSNIEITRVLTDQIRLSWDQVLGAQSYSIVSVNHARRTASTSNTEFALRNLMPGTEYSITITTIGQEAGIMSARSEEIVELTTIDAPETLQYRDVTTTTVTLFWESIEGTVHYVVRASSVDGDTRYESINNEVTLDNLSPGTQYSLSIATVDAKERESATSSEQLDVVTVTLPPENIQVHDLQSRSFVLAWDAPRGVVEYEITLMHGNRALTDETSTETSFTFSTLSPGTLYEVSVTALNANGRRSEAAIRQQRSIPLPPSSLQVFDIKPNSLNVSWNSATGGKFYDVYVTEVGVLSAPTSTFRFEDNFGRVSGLDSGIFYRIAVTTVTQENIRSARNATTRQQTLTSAPVNLQGTPVNESAISLDWNDVTGASYYNIYFYEGRERKTVVEAEQALDLITASEVVIGGLQPRVNYTFAVSASIEDGSESERSQSVSLQTYALSPELPESDEPLIRVLNISKTSFELEWDPILNAVSYVVVVRASIIVDEITVSGYNNTRLVVRQQISDMQYSVTLKAVGLIGDMTNESSPAAQFRTLPLAPPRPFGVRVTRIRATYFEITWEIMPRALSYDVDIYDEATGNNRTIRNIQGTTANITNLVLLNYYLFTVTSNGQYERSPPSNPVRVQARHPVPVMLRTPNEELIAVRDVTFSSLVILVAPIEHAESYIIIVRRNRATQERISNVEALTPIDIENLEQDTLYEITYQAVGRGGERSEESNVARIRTPSDERLKEVDRGRLIPDRPNDFRIVSVRAGEVTVQWSPARFAVSYRVSAQNLRTGLTRILNNVSSPYAVRDLEFRETYNLTVASVGKFFNSDFIEPITIDIPYPNPPEVNGLQVDQISTTSFRLRWHPTSFAIGYSVTVAEFAGRTRIIQHIRRIQYRVRDLRPGSTYNVTVEAISHSGMPVASSNYITVITARGSTPRPGDTTTVEPDDLLSSAVEALILLLSNIPDSLTNAANSSASIPREESREEIQFQEILEQRLQILRTEIGKQITRDESTSLIIPRIAGFQPQFDFGAQTVFTDLFSLGSEIKLIIAMNGSSSGPVVDSIANRLTLTLTELATIDSTLSGSATRRIIRELLFPIVNHQLVDVIDLAGLPDIITLPTITTDIPIAILVPPNTISSTGFTVRWGRHGNIHRYQLEVTEESPETGSKVIGDRVVGRLSFTFTTLKPSTTYSISIRPVDTNDDVIPGIVGRISTTTLEEADSQFNVNITNIGFNDVTLSWNTFPLRLVNLIFRISLKGDITSRQQLSVNRHHRSIRFNSLRPGTVYTITATANAQTFFERDITTMVGVPAPVTTVPPESDGLVPPAGLHLVNVGRNAITVEWQPVRIRGVSQSTIRYNLRLYTANTQRLRSINRFQQNTIWTFLTPLNARFYDVTVATYNILSRIESRESPRLRIDTRNSRRG